MGIVLLIWFVVGWVDGFTGWGLMWLGAGWCYLSGFWVGVDLRVLLVLVCLLIVLVLMDLFWFV